MDPLQASWQFLLAYAVLAPLSTVILSSLACRCPAARLIAPISRFRRIASTAPAHELRHAAAVGELFSLHEVPCNSTRHYLSDHSVCSGELAALLMLLLILSPLLVLASWLVSLSKLVTYPC